MKDIQQLQERFGIRGAVNIEAGSGGLAKIVVNTVLASGEIYLHGAHVTHFQPRNAAAVLYLSKNSLFASGKPIRGGVPLIFPWFGPRADDKTAPIHGFARTRVWGIESCDHRSDGSVRIEFSSASDAETLRSWPHAFSARLVVIVSAALDMTLEVRNTSGESFEFEEALHSYFSVGNVQSIEIDGLGGSEFLDRADGEKRKTQSPTPIRITGETDRLYSSTGAVTLRDPSLHRSIRVEKQHSGATVIWNPWTERARAMADLGADQWPLMMCVESANARESKIKLAAGGIHRMSTRISVGPL